MAIRYLFVIAALGLAFVAGVVLGGSYGERRVRVTAPESARDLGAAVREPAAESVVLTPSESSLPSMEPTLPSPHPAPVQVDSDPARLLQSLRPRGEYVDGKRHGRWVSTYPDGSIQREGSYDRGRMTGLWTLFGPEGQVLCEETFEDGRRHGPCRAYWPDGELHFELHYASGEPVDSVCTRWHANGRKEAEGAYLGGRKQGLWTEWHDSGLRAKEIVYERGAPTGISTEWWPSGRRRRQIDYRESPEGRVLGEWDENGNPEVELTD